MQNKLQSVPRIQLRGYQLDAVRDIADGWEKYRRVLLPLQPGMGKTEVACYLAQAHGCRVVFAAHLDNLVQQAAARFRKYHMNPHILQGNQPDMDARITVASKPTMARRVDTHRAFFESIGILIIDEAHISVDMSEKIISAAKNARVLLLTATPYTMDGGGLGRIADYILPTMSAEAAIAEGWKTPTEYVGIKKEINVKKSKGDFDDKELHKFMRENMLDDDPVGRWKKYAHGLQTIVFCVNIKHAHETATDFRRAGFPAAVVHTETELQPTDEHGRPCDVDTTLERFRRGEFLIIVNVQMLTIGSDFPACRCTLINRATNSRALWKQMNRADRLGVLVSDGMGTAGRLRAIASSSKPFSICIDMGANIYRHGYFENRDFYTLSGVEKKEPRIMSCPACLNPVKFKASTCHWCGCEIPEEQPREVKKSREEKTAALAVDKILQDPKNVLPPFLDLSKRFDDLKKLDQERMAFLTDKDIQEIYEAKRRAVPNFGFSFRGNAEKWDVLARARRDEFRAKIQAPDKLDAQKLYRELMKQFHPDVNPDPRAGDMAVLINKFEKDAGFLNRIKNEGFKIFA